jgi:choline dehydrogenase
VRVRTQFGLAEGSGRWASTISLSSEAVPPGAVLAARLSADPRRKVLLLEAGPIFATDRYPPVLTDANIVAGVSALPSFDWQYHTDGVGRLGHDNLPQGRVIGGNSAVNAAVAMRARPPDFIRWARRGIED